MLHYTTLRSSFASLHLHQWNKARNALFNTIHAFYARCISAILTAGVMVIGVMLLSVAFGIRMPFLTGLSHKSVASAETSQKLPAKTKLVAASATTTCDSSRHQVDPLYTGCPSFFVDYSNQQSGSVDPDMFNVFTGKPVANKEAEFYTSSTQNLRIANGNLILEARNQPTNGYSYTSARIDTHTKEDFLYGKLVVRAIMPDGIGTWPAIWLLPSQPKYAKLSPVSNVNRFQNDGEIDIAESVGVQPHRVYGVTHSIAYPEDGPDQSYYNTVTIPNNSTVFHDYELDWTPTSITFSIDNRPYFTYRKQPHADWRSWPFDQPFYLVMNLALGGTWAGSDKAQFPGDGIDKSALPAALKVNSIRYYSYIGSKSNK